MILWYSLLFFLSTSFVSAAQPDVKDLIDRANKALRGDSSREVSTRRVGMGVAQLTRPQSL
jgi:hypothetical protein